MVVDTRPDRVDGAADGQPEKCLCTHPSRALIPRFIILVDDVFTTGSKSIVVLSAAVGGGVEVDVVTFGHG